MTGANWARPGISGWPTSLSSGSSGREPQRRRVGAVVGRERIARAVRRHERHDVAELGIDDRRLDHPIGTLAPATASE